MTTRYFRRHEVGIYLTDKYNIPASKSWLAKLAVIGGGPEYHKAGRWPIYSQDALDVWAQARIGNAVSSTAEYSPKAA